MGTPLGPKYIPYTYMDPLGKMASCRSSTPCTLAELCLPRRPGAGASPALRHASLQESLSTRTLLVPLIGDIWFLIVGT